MYDPEDQSPYSSYSPYPSGGRRGARNQRSIIARIVFSILWLVPLIFIVNFLVGGVVGGIAGAKTTSAEAGSIAGANAAEAFFESYGRYVTLGELALWLPLCICGVLPGTSKFKRSGQP